VWTLNGTNFFEEILNLRIGFLLSSNDQMYIPIIQSTEDSAIYFFHALSGQDNVIFTNGFLVLE